MTKDATANKSGRILISQEAYDSSYDHHPDLVYLPGGRLCFSSNYLNSPAQDLPFRSSGEGEPRTGGYWVMWSSWGENGQAAVAKANRGREAGWIILPDLLSDPGMLVGALIVENCPEGVALLQLKDTPDGNYSNDPAYQVAGQLLAAQLNLAAGAETYPAIETAIRTVQLLLLSLDFSGTRVCLGPAGSAGRRRGGGICPAWPGGDRQLAQARQ